MLLYLPFEVIESLGVREGDEMDFFKYSDRAFLFAKKSDIATLLLSGGAKTEQAPQREVKTEEGMVSEEEIRVLKKIDTVKYADRSQENVGKLLNEREKALLQGLVKKKVVSLFKSKSTDKPVYSIPKDIYNRFLLRNPAALKSRVQQPVRQQFGGVVQQRPQYQVQTPMGNENVKVLEEKGFVVLQSESEASGVSLALEDSIRQGQVVGTRAFNKKFYIVLRKFFGEQGPRIMKVLSNGPAKVGDIARELKLDEDGARAVLYLLSESGEVSERRRDLFALA